jgi:hypothetical protein
MCGLDEKFGADPFTGINSITAHNGLHPQFGTGTFEGESRSNDVLTAVDQREDDPWLNESTLQKGTMPSERNERQQDFRLLIGSEPFDPREVGISARGQSVRIDLEDGGPLTLGLPVPVAPL